MGAFAAIALVVLLTTSSGYAGPPGFDARDAVRVVDLSVDSLPGERLGIGDPRPTLAWRMTSKDVRGNPCFDPSARGTCALDRQTAYEVEAASSEKNLKSGKLIWDTGKVRSSEQSVEFGRTLRSREAVYWRARVWDANGNVSPWSDTSTFTVGLLKQSDWSAEWIEDPESTYQTDGVPNPLPVFAKEFDLKRPVASATLYATGLGQYAATLNGRPIGKAVLEPGQTGYWDEVNYRTYDVTRLLERNDNVLGMEVGSGALQQVDTGSIGRYMFQPGNNDLLGTPKVRAQLELRYVDGRVQTIATDESWLARSGPTVFSSWWAGEDYDARIMRTGWTGSSRSLRDPSWHHAAIADLDGTTIPRDTTPLVADPRPPVTVAEEARPVSITEVQPAAANTTVVAPAAAGEANLKVATTTGIFTGDTITVAGQRHTVTEVGVAAKAATTLNAAAAAGATSIGVSALGAACRNAACEGSANFVIGQPIVVGTGSEAESVIVTGVTRNGTGNNSPGTVTVTPGLRSAHSQGTTVRGAGTGITITPALTAEVSQGAALTSEPKPAYVLDFGRNLVGLLKVTGSAPAGTTVSLLGSESPTPPTNYNTVSQSGIYRYTFAGTGHETWHAQFTYNGQRYVVVRGLPSPPTADTVKLLVTHASNPETAEFETCDAMLNSIYGITKRALQGNMISVLTDCPNREKGPYTGDNLHNIDAELTMYDMRAYQAQLVANMRASQRPNAVSDLRYRLTGNTAYNDERFNGLIANIAPEYHTISPYSLETTGSTFSFLDEPNWGGAVIRIPWELYKVYGDTSTFEPNYDAMVKWLDYETRIKSIRLEIPGLGDWSAAQATNPSQAIIDLGYYEGAKVLALIAEKLGKTADAQKYADLAADLKEEYNADYMHVDAETGRVWYANNTQAANAVALDSGLVPEEYRDEVFDSLVQSVADFDYRLSHGSVAGGAVFRALHAGGRDDLLYRMIINPQAPSYAFQVNRGQTTLSENLSGGGSQNHHFLGQVNDWFVHDLVGIDQPEGTIAYEKLLIRPAVGEGIDDIPCVEGSYTTPAGEASNRIVRSADRLVMDVTVPANTTAEVWVPTQDHPTVSAPRRAKFLKVEDGYTVYALGSGTFTFTAR
ncbi:family 78 glycoside hydrolase catalytic domain [Micromonospora sp. NPDC023966]|uniref:family 78 glycoside hydrolase catalytic domain n=1 Tax=Micromonospora sp. NPDC023966 TaxID=3154699 RepID=UPI003402FE94